MMTPAEMCEAMTAEMMAASKMAASEMPPSEMTSAKMAASTEMPAAKMAAPTEMPAAVSAATKMAPTVAASAAPAQRRARQYGHKNHSGHRNARPPHGTLPGPPPLAASIVNRMTQGRAASSARPKFGAEAAVKGRVERQIGRI